MGHTFSICATGKQTNLREQDRETGFHNGDVKDRLLHCTISRYQTLIKAIDSVGDPPLPIPNREVKPDSADGTAKICGRVGHRHFYLEALNESLGLLFSIIPTCEGSSCNSLYCRHNVHCNNYSTKLLPLVAKHSSKLGVSLAYSQHCGRVVPQRSAPQRTANRGMSLATREQKAVVANFVLCRVLCYFMSHRK